MIFEILHSYVGNETNKEKEAVSVMIWVRSEAWFIGNGANMYYLKKSMHNRSAIKIQVFPFKRHRNGTLGKIYTYMTPKLASYWLDKNKPLSINFLCIENVSCTECTLQYPQGVPSRSSPSILVTCKNLANQRKYAWLTCVLQPLIFPYNEGLRISPVEA